MSKANFCSLVVSSLIATESFVVLKFSLYGIFRLILPLLPKASLDYGVAELLVGGRGVGRSLAVGRVVQQPRST